MPCTGWRASCVEAEEAIPEWFVHPGRVLCNGCGRKVHTARLSPTDQEHYCLSCDSWRPPTT